MNGMRPMPWMAKPTISARMCVIIPPTSFTPLANRVPKSMMTMPTRR